jgi:hypothetical protein
VEHRMVWGSKEALLVALVDGVSSSLLHTNEY